MREIEFPQRSEQWFDARKGVLTASNFSKVLAKGSGATRKSYMMQLVAETLSNVREEGFTNAAMQWGVDHEDEAVAAYSFDTGLDVDEVSLCLMDDGRVGASPDGLVGGDGIIEVKCPNTVTFLEYRLANKLPSKYVAQVQGQLWVTCRKWCDFIAYDPRVANSLLVVRVERDEKYIEELEIKCNDFIEEMDSLLERLK